MKSDIAGHWAEGGMQNWIGLELLKGYAGKYKPDTTILGQAVAFGTPKI
ncbi:S-layer homology domain-containing protein [Paenibacillus sp. GXUN7292]